jgi:IS5 family transposase
MTDDFFRSRLDAMIHLNHPLCVLASRLPWQKMELALGPQVCAQRPAVEPAGAGS